MRSFILKFNIALWITYNGCFIILDIEILGHPVIFAIVYFPCASKPRKQELIWGDLRKFISEIDN